MKTIVENKKEGELARLFEIEELENRMEFARWDPPPSMPDDSWRRSPEITPEITYKF